MLSIKDRVKVGTGRHGQGRLRADRDGARADEARSEQSWPGSLDRAGNEKRTMTVPGLVQGKLGPGPRGQRKGMTEPCGTWTEQGSKWKGKAGTYKV